MPFRRFLAALAVSVLMHGILLTGSGLLGTRRPSDERPALTAILLPPVPAPPEESPLLKNTLSDGIARHASPPPARPGGQPAPSVQRKLDERVYYPPEAIAQGWEGEVRLLITLDEGGRITDVRVAVSSGHTLLDEAAVKAAYAARRLPAESRREILWPVSFRLDR